MTEIIPRTIQHTTSLCPVCHAQIDAQVIERDHRVYLHKHCTEHGPFEVLIHSDSKWYFPSAGNEKTTSACCGGKCGSASPATAEAAKTGEFIAAPSGMGHDPAIIEELSTCIALIEIVTTCNLKCPTCFADSPFATQQSHDFLALEEFHRRVGQVIARKGKIDVLQLSGGEPTLHPQFFELLEWVQTHPDIGYTLLNTNGVLLAQDDAFMEQLAQLHRRHRRMEIYLQYDGPQADGQFELRGADLRALRLRVLDRCAEANIPVTLAMAVNEQNLAYLGETLKLAMSHEAVRGITFQPVFHSGRGTGELVQIERNIHRLNAGDIIHRLIEQSEGLLCERDFTPLPCGNPNCHTIGYLLRRDGDWQPISRWIDFSQLQDFLAQRVDYSMDDLAKCGCESEPLGQLLQSIEVGPDDVLRLFIKPFMDAWTYDQSRIDRCCVHVIGENGSLESFCRHYAMQ